MSSSIMVAAVVIAAAVVAVFTPRVSDSAPSGVSWWRRLGAQAFSWAGGIALLIAAVVVLSSGAGQLVRLVLAGAAVVLLVVSQRISERYAVTANVLAGTAIGVLSAVFFSVYQWNQPWTLLLMLGGMAAVASVAVAIAMRRNSIFVAVAALAGGFLPVALTTPADAPAAVFAYLVILTAGLVWLAAVRHWPLLAAAALALSTLYVWTWILGSMTMSLIPFAASVVAALAIIAAAPYWIRRAEPARFEWVTVAMVHLSLLFGIYVAAQPSYAPQFNVLFAFLLVVDAGLMAIVWRGGPKWLHAAGAIATLLTWIIWLRVSYTPASWPMLLVWAALFVALYLARITPFSGWMFALFIGVAWREPEHWAPIVIVMLSLLIVAIVRGRPWVAATAIAMCAIALMLLHPPLWLLIALHALLLAALLVVAWTTGQHELAVMAIPFYLAMIATATTPNATFLTVAAVPYLLFAVYALLARTTSVAPYAAAALASLVLLVAAWHEAAGIVALIEAAVMLVLLWRAGSEPRITLAAAAMLALFNIALPQLLSIDWTVAAWAVESAALIWLFLKVKHPVALLFGVGLAVVVFLQLAFNANLFSLYLLYALCGGAMFAAAYIIRYYSQLLQRILSVFCLFELWFLINLVIANWFHSSNGSVVFDFAASSATENAVYTVSWAAIATGLLILGFLIRWPAARGAALSLLVASVLKCFLNDLPRLSGSALTASLVGLGLSVAVVGVVLQRRWSGKSIGFT